MKVLSLFDGMSCGQIALRQLMLLNGFENLRIDTYYASEIDKYAIAQTQHNFPDTVQLGDVERWREWDIDWEHLDLVMGGSPCQGFSFAGKQLAFDDPRSRLFFVFAEILDYARTRNPRVKFLLENVNMKKDHLRIISERVGVFPVNINSALVSAQNRNRWYWTDIRTRQENLFGDVYSDIPQPEDRGILLRDILEFEVDEKYYLNKKSSEYVSNAKRMTKKFTTINGDKAICLMEGYANKWNGTFIKDVEPIRVRMTGRNPENPSDRRAGIYLEQTLEAKTDGKTNCLTSVAKDNLILQLPRGKNNGGFHAEKAPTLSANAWEQNNLVIQLNPSKESGGQHPYQQHRVYDPDGKAPALMAQLCCGSYAILEQKETGINVLGNIYDNGHNSQAGRVYSTEGKSTALRGEAGGVGSKTGLYLSGSRIRRLTPTECARLQTVPEWYEWICSETQQYRMLGNGWSIAVITHILSFLNKEL